MGTFNCRLWGLVIESATRELAEPSRGPPRRSGVAGGDRRAFSSQEPERPEGVHKRSPAIDSELQEQLAQSLNLSPSRHRINRYSNMNDAVIFAPATIERVAEPSPSG